LSVAELGRREKQQLIMDLAGDGAFGGRNMASYISRVLGLGRATVYNYLKQTGNGGSSDE
jgi:predicted transcriptional regulator YheO